MTIPINTRTVGGVILATAYWMALALIIKGIFALVTWGHYVPGFESCFISVLWTQLLFGSELLKPIDKNAKPPL